MRKGLFRTLMGLEWLLIVLVMGCETPTTSTTTTTVPSTTTTTVPGTTTTTVPGTTTTTVPGTTTTTVPSTTTTTVPSTTTTTVPSTTTTTVPNYTYLVPAEQVYEYQSTGAGISFTSKTTYTYVYSAGLLMSVDSISTSSTTSTASGSSSSTTTDSTTNTYSALGFTSVRRHSGTVTGRTETTYTSDFRVSSVVLYDESGTKTSSITYQYGPTGLETRVDYDYFGSSSGSSYYVTYEWGEGSLKTLNYSKTSGLLLSTTVGDTPNSQGFYTRYRSWDASGVATGSTSLVFDLSHPEIRFVQPPYLKSKAFLEYNSTYQILSMTMEGTETSFPSFNYSTNSIVTQTNSTSGTTTSSSTSTSRYTVLDTSGFGN